MISIIAGVFMMGVAAVLLYVYLGTSIDSAAPECGSETGPRKLEKLVGKPVRLTPS
jgi:hypothetical protein